MPCFTLLRVGFCLYRSNTLGDIKWSSVRIGIWTRLCTLSQIHFEALPDHSTMGSVLQCAVRRKWSVKISSSPEKQRQLQYYLFQRQMIYHSGQKQIQETWNQRMRYWTSRAGGPGIQKSGNPETEKCRTLVTCHNQPVGKQWASKPEPADFFKESEKNFAFSEDMFIEYQWKKISS